MLYESQGRITFYDKKVMNIHGIQLIRMKNQIEKILAQMVNPEKMNTNDVVMYGWI